MKKLEIKPEKGYEIDLEKSDITKGIIEFKKIKKVYPTTLDELKTSIANTGLYYINRGCRSMIWNERYKSDSGYFASKELLSAFITLSDLIRFRDEYRDGWVPDWKSECPKESISSFKGIVTTGTNYSLSRLFSFETEEIRDIFYTNFTKKLEQVAKFDLI